MATKKLKNKIIVAMSGGVDSSVAAALLEKAGYDVIGVFIKFWFSDKENENKCCSSESEKRARKVAKILNIPFYVFNFKKEFKRRIVDKFLKGYKKGITPNPCVVCNKEIKFGLLLEKTLALGVDYVATGHYAKIKKRFVNLQQIRNSLISAKDKNKDQSYFLWKLGQSQLKHILFPVGNYTRTEVEKMAKKFKLPFSNVQKSMEICFVQTTINDFLKKYLKPRPGKIIDTAGKTIGQHQGSHFYTIGQRKGIGLAGGPYYVLGKNLKKNLLIITKNERDLLKRELICKNVNWISGKVPKLPQKVKVKIRYRHEPAEAIIRKLQATSYKLQFKTPQRAITPGQSAVFYRGEELLGGGIIC